MRLHRIACALFLVRRALHSGAAEAEILLHARRIAAEHVLHHANVAVNIHRLAAVKVVELLVKALDEGVHRLFDALLRAG